MPGAHIARRLGPWLLRLRAWLGMAISWLIEPRLFWLGLTVLVLSLVVALWPEPVFPGTREQIVRLTGLVLQLCGLVTVALGIRYTRKLFGRAPLQELARMWLHRFPRWPRDAQVHVTGTGSMTAGVGIVSGRLEVVPKTLKARVAALENVASELQKDVDGLRAAISSQAAEHAQALAEERDTRSDEDRRLGEQLESASAGGLYLSLVGVVWLLVGVVLSTSAPEIAALLK